MEVNNKLSYKSIAIGKKFDKHGNIIKQLNKKSSGFVNLDDLGDERACLDAMMMVHSIKDEDFKNLLLRSVNENEVYTTNICRKEAIGTLIKELKIDHKKAKEMFSEFEKEFSLKYLEFNEEYFSEGKELFDKVMSSDIKIRKIETFLRDCVNIITILKNKIRTFYSNDEDLEKVCKRFELPIEIVRIADSSEKVVKDYFNQFKSKSRFKKRRHQKKRKAKR